MSILRSFKGVLCGEGHALPLTAGSKGRSRGGGREERRRREKRERRGQEKAGEDGRGGRGGSGG